MLIIVWVVKSDSTVLTSLHVQTRRAQLGESPVSASSLLWCTMHERKTYLYKKRPSPHSFSHPHMHTHVHTKNMHTRMHACMHINMPTPYPTSACAFNVGGKQLCCLQYVYIMYILFT